MIPERYYRVLGLSGSASNADVKKAYRQLAKRLHPDKNPSSAAHEQFIRITEAYEIILGQRQIPKSHSKSPKTNGTQHDHNKNKQGKPSPKPEQEHILKALRFKKQKEKEARIEYLKQLKRYMPLRSGWNVKIFNAIVVLSVFCLSLVTFDYFLPSRISRHQLDYWTLEGYSIFYATNTYTLNFDQVRSASVVGNATLNLASNDIIFLEKTQILREPRAFYMPTKLDYWKMPLTTSMFSFLPYVYILLLIPIVAWMVKKNIWFFHYWFYTSVYASGPFVLYFFLDELRILRVMQLI